MRKLLILDDDQHVRLSFLDYFEDLGWDVHEARSGEEALGLLEDQSFCPDAAMVDIRLHGMTGEEFIGKALSANDHTCFLICTGSPDLNISATILAQDRVSGQVFKKPVSDLEALERTITDLISKSAG